MSDTIQFEDMSNKELAQLVADFSLTVEAKNPAKPNKTEYVTALTAYKAKQDAINGNEPEEIVEEAEEVVGQDTITAPTDDTDLATKVLTNKGYKLSSKAQLLRADLFRKERIIVTDLRESQTREPTVYVNWGNALVGNNTDVISLDGQPQFVRRGAIANLEAARLTIHEADSLGADKMIKRNRFVITRVGGMSQDELTELGVKQRMRDAKH